MREWPGRGRGAIRARIRAVSHRLRDNAVLVTVSCALIMVLLVAIQVATQGLVFLGLGASQGKAGATPAAAGGPELSAIGQARQIGDRVWGSRVELPDEGGRVALALRVYNTGLSAVTNVAVRMPVPDPVNLVPGSCRLRIDGIPLQQCQGSLSGEGTVIAVLPARSWLHLVVLGEVPARVPGGRFPTVASVGSDQTPEASVEIETVVSLDPVETAVRRLYRKAAEVEPLRGPPELAPRSRRLLVERWAQLAPGSGREFGELPDGPSLGLLRLYFGRRFEGQVIELRRAKVLSPPWEFSAPRGAVEQSMEVGQAGGGAKGWCFTVRPRDDLLRAGDLVDVKAVPIGWGGLESRRGQVPVTLLACPAMRLSRRGGEDLLRAPSIAPADGGQMARLPLPGGVEPYAAR